MNLKLIIFIGLFSFSVFSQKALTNQSVIDLVDLGFGKDVIMSKINSSDLNFKTDITSLKQLKSNSVPSEVIALMIDKSKVNTQTPTGIYYKNRENKDIKIQPNVFAGKKVNVLAYALTSGVANANTKAYINGKSSSNIIRPNQNFIFRFSSESDSKKLSKTNWWFNTATSPQEFVLAKMSINERKSRRQIITGKIGIASGGASSGVDSKNTVPFKIEVLDNNTYKVIPINPIPVGEYCFYYKGTIPTTTYSTGVVTNQSVFDFSVR